MKTSLLNALGSIFVTSIVALVVFVGYLPATASAAFLIDDFDSYSVGAISGQGGWIQEGSGGDIVDTSTDTPPNALAGGSQKKNVDDLATGVMFWSLYYPSGGTGYAQVGLDKPDGEDIFFSCKLNDCYTYRDGNFEHPFAGISADEWHRLGIQWQVSDHTVRFYLDGTWSSWYNFSGYWDVDPSEVLVSLAQTNFLVDSISDTEAVVLPPVAGYEPILTPTSPVRNTETVVDFDDGFTVSGNIQIPTLNTHSYKKLVVTFRKPDALIASQNLVFDLVGLVGGQSLDYSATTTVPVTTSGDNFFKVSYTINGSEYATSQANNPPVSTPLLSFDNTWVKDSSDPAPADLITESIKPAQEALEDCGVYSGIDAVVCNLKNFIVGAFLPSDAAINQFNSTMNGFKTKFPMNYAAAITDTLTAIGAGVSDTSGFSFNLYGNAGVVDTSFFAQDLGSGVTIGGTIKLILTFLVFVVFLIWGVGYMHRIFN